MHSRGRPPDNAIKRTDNPFKFGTLPNDEAKSAVTSWTLRGASTISSACFLTTSIAPSEELDSHGVRAAAYTNRRLLASQVSDAKKAADGSSIRSRSSTAIARGRRLANSRTHVRRADWSSARSRSDRVT